MDDVIVVQILKAKQDLLGVACHQVLGEIKPLVVRLKGALCNIFQKDVQMLFILVSSQVFDDVLVLKTVQKLNLLLKRPNFSLLSTLVSANFVNRHLLNSYLPSMLQVEAFIHIAK